MPATDFCFLGTEDTPVIGPKATLARLMVDFDTDAECRSALETLRWPSGICCLRCGSTSISRITTRKQFDCNDCRYRFSVTTGTIFNDSHLPLPKWFMAVFLMCEAKKGMSANQMKRTLGVAAKTAWYLCHRIRKAMAEVNPEPLTGIVECDETYIGGKRRVGTGNDKKHKAMVLAALQRGGGDVHTNSVEGAFGLFKRAIVGSFHQVSHKHLDRYLDEFEFRYNNRRNAHLFRDTLTRLVRAEAMPYEELTASA